LPILLLAALVAVTGTAILALATAYRRADTVVHRWTAGAIPYDRQVLAQLGPSQMAAMPGVVRADRRTFVAATPVESNAGLDGYAMEMSAVDSTYLLLGGSIPDGSDPFEVLVNEAAARMFKLRPGDHFRVRFYSPDQLSAVSQGDYTARGPVETVRIAGVIRSPGDISSDRWVVPRYGGTDASPSGVAASIIFPISLYDRFGDQILRFGLAWTYDVQLAPGTDEPAFEARVQAAVGAGVDDVLPAFDSSPPPGPPRIAELAAPIRAQAGILGALLAVIAVASSLAVAAASRTVQRQFDRDRTTLTAIGASQRTVVATALVRSAPAVVAGLALAVPLAWSISNRLPIGLAAQVEPSPGRTLNSALCAVVIASWGLVVVTCILVTAGVRVRPARSATPRRRPVAGAPRHLDLAITLSRSAAGRGALRTGAAASTMAVVALCGTGVFIAGLDRLVDRPALHGFWGDVMVGNSNFDLTDQARAAVAALPGVRSVSEVTQLPLSGVGDQTVDVLALQPSDLASNRIAAHGRFPVGPREILLGADLAASLHKGLGDVVTITGQNDPTDFTVVGIGPSLVLGDTPFGSIAVISSRAMGDDWPGPAPQILMVELDAGRNDKSAAVAALYRSVPGHDLATDIVPAGIDNLYKLRGLLLAVAVVAAILATLLTVNATVAATRGRARESAILRACGATPRDLLAIAAVQGLGCGLFVGLVGAAVGAAAGGRVWVITAHALGVPVRLPLSGLLALAVVVPVVAHVTMSSVVWWRVKSRVVASRLRTE
jgi:ABC-type lipoprotein release transport system permease subunit